jgi:hypothetical protein
MMVEHAARTQMGKQENSQIVETAKEARGAESRSDHPQRAGMEPWSRGGSVCRHLFHVFPDLGFLRIQHAEGKADPFPLDYKCQRDQHQRDRR